MRKGIFAKTYLDCIEPFCYLSLVVWHQDQLLLVLLEVQFVVLFAFVEDQISNVQNPGVLRHVLLPIHHLHQRQNLTHLLVVYVKFIQLVYLQIYSVGIHLNLVFRVRIRRFIFLFGGCTVERVYWFFEGLEECEYVWWIFVFLVVEVVLGAEEVPLGLCSNMPLPIQKAKNNIFWKLLIHLYPKQLKENLLGTLLSTYPQYYIPSSPSFNNCFSFSFRIIFASWLLAFFHLHPLFFPSFLFWLLFSSCLWCFIITSREESQRFLICYVYYFDVCVLLLGRMFFRGTLFRNICRRSLKDRLILCRLSLWNLGNVIGYLWAHHWPKLVFSWTTPNTIPWIWMWSISSEKFRGYWAIVSTNIPRDWLQFDNPY